MRFVDLATLPQGVTSLPTRAALSQAIDDCFGVMPFEMYLDYVGFYFGRRAVPLAVCQALRQGITPDRWDAKHDAFVQRESEAGR